MASRVTARRRRRQGADAPPPAAPQDLLRHRCRTLIRRGRRRQAIAALRELANRDQDAAVWVRLGAMLAHCERADASVDAFKQGWFLHRQRGDHRRAAVVSTLIEQVQAGAWPRAA